jgi:hypothetical protein
MPTQHESLYADVVAYLSPRALDYTWNEAWTQLWDDLGVLEGHEWDERCLEFINCQLGTLYTDLPGAQSAFAANRGFANWSVLSQVVFGAPSSGPLVWFGSPLVWNAADMTWTYLAALLNCGQGLTLTWFTAQMTWGGRTILWRN